MTGDEARKLIGGYATGSLTEAERTALFQAALEDQDLFDELAGEQGLKEVLNEPGARQRLITALEPPRKHRAWLWATAAATVAVAVVIGIVVSQRTAPPPQEIAQVLKSPEPVAVGEPAPPATPPVRRKTVPEPASPAELKKEEPLADQLQAAKPEAEAAARGFAAGAPAVARLRAENSVVSAFAFNYTVGADGYLEIVPTSPGFLSVTANDAVVFPSTAVFARTPVRIQIPSGATSLVIGFYGTRGIAGAPVRRDEASGTVTDQDPPNARITIQLFLKPATQ